MMKWPAALMRPAAIRQMGERPAAIRGLGRRPGASTVSLSSLLWVWVGAGGGGRFRGGGITGRAENKKHDDECVS